ncbi:hypothetical protein DESAMIL20_690 [Desulfurella amilsii]|jgi:hypothetical protein|uniref:Uncharacterized protein n=1 Tax=Desulfurella amilsii TaxID=1562698 RepID=A0A1X4XY85_9BACT|nr:hypothetical protein [Desulfurella amilsii]OSS42506.1 hypothetical protein DESAMIL20_690 [Desulfurella amilsii]
MWLLENERPNLFNLRNFYKVELERKEEMPNLFLYQLSSNKSDLIIKKFSLEKFSNAFKEKLNNFLKINKFLFIETNYQKFIWINSNFVVSIVNKLKAEDVTMEIETTSGLTDSIEIGSRIHLQLFIVKNIEIIAMPTTKEETRGIKSKYDIASTSF